MEPILRTIKSHIPRKVFTRLQPAYHFILAFVGMVRYRHPSRHLTVIAVTGTKGKSSVVEILGHLLRADGKKVATLSTIQFSIGDNTERNLFKMTMPGRFFVQSFLRRAVDAGCTHAVVEMTSEGAKQFRHRFIALDTLIFNNLSPEHIESHGSFAKYKDAKLELARAVARSPKRPRTLIANGDDEHGKDFVAFPVERALTFSLNDLTLYTLHKDSVSMIMEGTTLRVPLIGLFNVYNVLAAMSYARSIGVSLTTIERALATLPPIAGRVEQFTTPTDATKPLTVVVDYAHTPDSLEKLYQAFPDKVKIAVLGNTGGGRDTWKRPEMAAIAERYCAHVFLTNEDPYDEDPVSILEEMAAGITDQTKVTTILDRRAAIAKAIEHAPAHSVVLVSGKGTDPYIMGPRGTKEPWSDASVVQELLAQVPRTTTNSAT